MAKSKKVSGMIYFSDSDSSEDDIDFKKITALKTKSVFGTKKSSTGEYLYGINDLPKKSSSEPAQKFDIYTRQIGKFANTKRNLDKVPASTISLDQECENLSSEEDIPVKLKSKKPLKKNNSKLAKAKGEKSSKETLDKPVLEVVDGVVDCLLQVDSHRDEIAGRLRSRVKRPNSESVAFPIDYPVPKLKPLGKAFSKTIDALDENLKLFENTESFYVSGSDEEIAEEITVRIQCLSNIKKFRMKLDQEFSTIIEALAKDLDVDKTDVYIYFGSDVIYPTDTPDSRNIRPSEILCCFTGNSASTAVEINSCAAINVNEIELMVQSSLYNKKKISFKIDKTKPLKVLAEEFASQNNVDVTKVNLKFDGDVIDLEESAVDLDIESGDCIDIIVR